jgi:hypothetical protein
MMFSHWYQKVLTDSEPLLQDESDSFVARFVLTPPGAEMGGCCRLVEKNSSRAFEDEHGEFSTMCVTGGTLIQMREHVVKHKAYGYSWLAKVAFWLTAILSVFVFVPLIFKPLTKEGSDEEGSDEEVSAKIGANILIWVLAFSSVRVGAMARSYVDQNAERRGTAIQSFRSDLRLHLTQITVCLQPFGYVVSTQEKDGDTFEVVIKKSLGWKKDGGLPPAPTEENQVMLTEAAVMSIQIGSLARDTPLDIWFFGGLMMRLQNANNLHTKNSRQCGMTASVIAIIFWIVTVVAAFNTSFGHGMLIMLFGVFVLFLEAWAVLQYKECTDAPRLHTALNEIVENLSPISDERVGYTMNYTIKPGSWLRGTRGTIGFQENTTKEGGNVGGLMVAQIV